MKITLKLFSLFTGLLVAFALTGCGTATEEVAPPEEGMVVGEAEVIDTEPAPVVESETVVVEPAVEAAPAIEAVPATEPAVEAAPAVEPPAEEPKP